MAFFTQVDQFFYLVYILFGVYVVGRLWARRSLASVTVQRFHDRRVFLDQSFEVGVSVHNQGWLPVLWIRLTDSVPVELSVGRGFRQVVSLNPRERLRLAYTLNGRRRGYYSLGPLTIVGGDLLGSKTYEHQDTEDDFVIVYPRIIALRDLGLPSQSPFGVVPSRERIFEDPTRIQGVRDYQPGDSLRRMDWKTSARVGSLQVRRFEPAISLETAIFLNLNGDDYVQRHRDQATELGIVVAASVAAHLTERRQAVGFFTNGADPFSVPSSEMDLSRLASAHPPRKGREHLMTILDLLARIERSTEDEALPFLDLLNRKSLGLSWGSTVVIVTAQEEVGLVDTLLSLRRRGLAVILVLTCPDQDYAQAAERAGQIGVLTHRIWTEQELDVWR